MSHRQLSAGCDTDRPNSADFCQLSRIIHSDPHYNSHLLRKQFLYRLRIYKNSSVADLNVTGVQIKVSVRDIAGILETDRGAD